MFSTTVEDLLRKALEEREDLFLIDLDISADNRIKVIIDGDNGVTVEDCVFVSRAIEHNLDREAHDFSLEVMSAGASTPLVNKRQYKKNINRTLELKTENEAIEGVLTNASDNDITIEWKSREPKPAGKGKMTVNKKATIAYDDIIEAKVMIKF